ncbi:unnamed protein product [Urochloa humidicola]
MERLCGRPSLELGIRVVRVAGLDPADHQLEGSGGTLFVRYYVPAGDGRRRLCVDTREVPCAAGGGDVDGPFWGELARFERWGSSAPGAAATGPAIAFELRWRPRPSLSSGLAAALLGAGGRRPASRVLARADLEAWPAEGAAAKERWLALAPAGRRELAGAGSKAPRLLVGVSAVFVPGGEGKNRVKKPGGGASECCGAGERCGQCGWVGNEEDMFLAATFAQ